MKTSAYRRQVPTYIPGTELGSQPYPYSHASRNEAEKLTSEGLNGLSVLTGADRREATRKQQAVK